MMKHILITGGAGFIGSNTVRYALDKGLTVSVLDSFENAVLSKDVLLELGAHVLELDIQDPRAVKSMGGTFDAIVHLAAQISVPKSIKHPGLLRTCPARRPTEIRVPPDGFWRYGNETNTNSERAMRPESATSMCRKSI